VDVNKDDKPDKKFSDAAEFNKWLKKDKPDFKDSLSWPDWSYAISRF